MLTQNIGMIVKASGGKIIQRGKNNKIMGISTDSRDIKTASLFIPLVGDKFDGHNFLLDAKLKGANAVLYEKGKNIDFDKLKDIYIIEVADSLRALQDISMAYRNLFNIPLIAVTGSTGKTSTKDIISDVLLEKFNVLKNIGNFNNHIGLPLTILNLKEEHQIGVLEMGMTGLGEISELSRIVKPHIGVITNIGMSHIGRLGSRDNIMRAKLELADYLGEGDYLLLNGDNDYLSTIKDEEAPYQKIFFGLSEENDFYPKRLENLGEKGYSFFIKVDGKESYFRIKEPGIHNVYNAMAAIWIGNYFKMDVEKIKLGLENYTPSRMRMESKIFNGVKVINDAYNASPDSMKAALDILRSMDGERKIAILGNMFELGEFSREAHRNVGKYIGDGVDILITVGQMAEEIANEAIAMGMDPNQIYRTMTNDQVIRLLGGLVKKKDIILVKGSRGMTMEEIVHYLQERS